VFECHCRTFEVRRRKLLLDETIVFDSVYLGVLVGAEADSHVHGVEFLHEELEWVRHSNHSNALARAAVWTVGQTFDKVVNVRNKFQEWKASFVVPACKSMRPLPSLRASNQPMRSLSSGLIGIARKPHSVQSGTSKASEESCMRSFRTSDVP
jgi:hypothetical protein